MCVQGIWLPRQDGNFTFHNLFIISGKSTAVNDNYPGKHKVVGIHPSKAMLITL